MKFAEIPQRLNPLLHPPDPIVINHVISVEGGTESKQTACYDIDVEVRNLKFDQSVRSTHAILKGIRNRNT